MAGCEGDKPTVKRPCDVILFQHIGGGWEYQYISECETYRGFGYDPVHASARLFHQLGWDRRRFDRAQFRRF
jgi:hypothetical protein